MISVWALLKAHQSRSAAARKVLPDFFGSLHNTRRNRSSPRRPRRNARARTRRWWRLSRQGWPFSLFGRNVSANRAGSRRRRSSVTRPGLRGRVTDAVGVLNGRRGGPRRAIVLFLAGALPMLIGRPLLSEA